MRKHRELVFIIVGVLLLLTVIGFVIPSINFLLKTIDEALNQESVEAKRVAGFNLDGLKKLDIIKD